MAYYMLEETGLSGLGPSSQSLAYGVHGIPAAANFFGQEGSSYIGELEEALMQGAVDIRTSGDRKAFLAARQPPTLEIFPSWPMSFQEPPKGNSQSAESTDSGNAQNTSSGHVDSPQSRKASGQASEQKKKEMDSAARRPGTATADHDHPHDKRKLTQKNGKPLDAKTLRRLAQNREAAKKSRLRKKAYVQQLESSRIKLSQLEQDLQRTRPQGLFFGGGGGAGGSISSGAAMFDMEYARWLEEGNRYMSELRGGLQARLPDGDLRILVDECLAHYDEMFRLKGMAAASDAFHLITGTWTTPAERCFLWIGGFRPSEMLKILTPQLDPLTEQQLVDICNLQLSAQQAEEALTKGLEQLQQSLAEIVAGGNPLCEVTNASGYMGQMAMALGKLSNLEGFIRQEHLQSCINAFRKRPPLSSLVSQTVEKIYDILKSEYLCKADNLRQQTLHQMRRILTIRQAARCFLAIREYYSRLRALSSLWASRPRE